jgi:hypothetical protein
MVESTQLTGSNVSREVSDEDSGPNDLYRGFRNSATFTKDDPRMSRDGNQISGRFSLSWDGNAYLPSVMSSAVFTVQNPGNDTDRFMAMSAKNLADLLNLNLFGSKNCVQVVRSSVPSKAMGFSYTIYFVHEDVGEEVPSLRAHNRSLLGGDESTVWIEENTKGNSIRGTFQLRFYGETTRPLPHDATAGDVQDALNQLMSIAPSVTLVSRTPLPMRVGPINGIGGFSTQVGGYVWSITFSSNKWRDPTTDHNVSYVPGNWFGRRTTMSDTWGTGFSKVWGGNVGDVPLMECIASGLYTTNGLFPVDGCKVSEFIPGTNLLKGQFTLCLDTLSHSNGVMSIPISDCADWMDYDAVASAAESGNDGSSMEEKLEALVNLGDVSVTRTLVDERNGGYTWTIRFLRDADGPCQQKDDYHHLCNSPKCSKAL